MTEFRDKGFACTEKPIFPSHDRLIHPAADLEAAASLNTTRLASTDQPETETKYCKPFTFAMCNDDREVTGRRSAWFSKDVKNS